MAAQIKRINTIIIAMFNVLLLQSQNISFLTQTVDDNFDEGQIIVIDQIAQLMQNPENHIFKLQELYDQNSFINTKEQLIDTYYKKDDARITR